MKMFLKSLSTSFTRAFNTAGVLQCPSRVLKAVQSGHLRAEAVIHVFGGLAGIYNCLARLTSKRHSSPQGL